MSGSIKLKHASGNGVIIAAPSSNPAADRTLTLPSDADGVIAKTDASGNLAVTGDLTVDTDTLKVDSSNNRVGVGTTSPDRTIHCHNSSNTTNVRAKFSNGTTGEGASDGFEIGINGSDPAQAVLVNYEASPIAFFTNATERMRIDSSGNVGIGETTAADNRIRSTSPHQYNVVAKSSNGNGGYENFTGLTSTAAKTFYVTHNGRVGAADGIIFGSDTAAANILNDYETGNWTPSVVAGNPLPTISNIVSASYTKIGRLVTVSAYFNMNSTSSNTDNLVIGGLPFTAVGGTKYSYGTGRIGTIATPAFQVNTGATNINAFANSGNAANWNNAIGSYILFSVTYEAA